MNEYLRVFQFRATFHTYIVISFEIQQVKSLSLCNRKFADNDFIYTPNIATMNNQTQIIFSEF